MIKYSENEIEMFTELGFSDLLDHLEPYQLYRLCCEDAFVNNKSGWAVESLRNGMKAMRDCKPHRLTAEFENLIKKEYS